MKYYCKIYICFQARLSAANIGFERPNENIAHYKMLKHEHGIPNPKRNQLLQIATNRYKTDGLNNLKLNVVDTKLNKLFTHFQVNVGEPPLDLKIEIEKAENRENENKVPRLSNNDKVYFIKLLADYSKNKNFTNDELISIRTLFLNLEKL